MSFFRLITVGDQSTYSKPFVSFDIDWAHDDVVFDVFKLVSAFDVDTTWMVTHETDLLNDLANSDNCELGIHLSLIHI